MTFPHQNLHLLSIITENVLDYSSASQWCFSCSRCHVKCTSTVSDSSNLEIRLEGVLFIRKQSFKELRECAQSASNSALGQEDTHSVSPALHSVLIRFSAVFMPTQNQSFCLRDSSRGQGGERQTHRTTVFIHVMTKEKGLRRMGLKRCAEGRRAAALLLYILTVQSVQP